MGPRGKALAQGLRHAARKAGAFLGKLDRIGARVGGASGKAQHNFAVSIVKSFRHAIALVPAGVLKPQKFQHGIAPDLNAVVFTDLDKVMHGAELTGKRQEIALKRGQGLRLRGQGEQSQSSYCRMTQIHAANEPLEGGKNTAIAKGKTPRR